MRKTALIIAFTVTFIFPVFPGFAQENSGLWSYDTDYGTFEFKISNTVSKTSPNSSTNASLAIKEGDQIQYSYKFTPRPFNSNGVISCLSAAKSGVTLEDVSLISNFLFNNGDYINSSTLEFRFIDGEISMLDNEGNFAFDSGSPIQMEMFGVGIQIYSPSDNEDYLKCFDFRTVNYEINETKVLFEYRGLLEQSIKPVQISSINLSREGFSLPATSTSGLKVTIESLTPRVCEAYQRYVTLIKAGRCALGLSQSGNTYFFPAEDEVVEFVVINSSKTLPLCIGPNQVLQLKSAKAKCPAKLIKS